MRANTAYLLLLVAVLLLAGFCIRWSLSESADAPLTEPEEATVPFLDSAHLPSPESTEDPAVGTYGPGVGTTVLGGDTWEPANTLTPPESEPEVTVTPEETTLDPVDTTESPETTRPVIIRPPLTDADTTEATPEATIPPTDTTSESIETTEFPETTTETGGETTEPEETTSAYVNLIDPGASQGLIYKLNSDGKSYAMTGYGSFSGSDLVISSTYQGLPVTEIRSDVENTYMHLTDGTKIASIRIPDSVQTIGTHAINISGVTELYIPKSVTTLHPNSFYCRTIEAIAVDPENPVYHSAGNCIIDTGAKTLIMGCAKSVIPDDGSVTEIARLAFNVEGNNSIRIPESVEIIREGAFLNSYSVGLYTSLSSVPAGWEEGWTKGVRGVVWGCPKKDSDMVYSTVLDPSQPSQYLLFELNEKGTAYTLIGPGAWKGTHLVIPDTYNGLPVKAIGQKALADLDIVGVYFPESLESIGMDAFWDCKSLTSVHLPKNVTSLYRAFMGCNLRTVTIDPENPEYHSVGSCIINTASKELVIGSSTSIIPDDGSVTSIGIYAFYKNTALTSIVIPDAVTKIGSYAFEQCTSLAEIRIGNGLSEMSENPFAGCTALKKIEVSPENSTYTAVNGCLIHKANRKLICMAVNGTIPSDGSVTRIGSYAFAYREDLAYFRIPDGITNIGSYAFAYCPNLQKAYIPESAILGWWVFNMDYNAVIYTPLTNAPDSWANYWDNNTKAVIWGYTGDFP